MLRSLVILPDTRLRQKAHDVTSIDQNLITTLHAMHTTMITAKGIGLAGPQIADMRRIIVVDLQDRDTHNPERPLFFINPVITSTSDDEDEAEEGCLSLPRQLALVIRPSHIEISFLDTNGNHQTLEASGLFARCLQHEVDHLNGVLFIDHLSRLKRNIMTKKAPAIKKDLLDDTDFPLPIAPSP